MASYVEVKSTLNFLMGYVCSKCKAVNLAQGTLLAIGRGPFKKGAQASADKAVADGIKAINACEETPIFMGDYAEFRNEVGFNTVGGYHTMNMQYPCPFCGHVELWQKSVNGCKAVSQIKRSRELDREILVGYPQESCPKRFMTGEEANAWRSQKVAELSTLAIKHWDENPEEKQAVLDQLNGIDAKLAALDQEQQGMSAAVAPLEQQIAAKTAEAKSFGMFSKERKAANAEVKELNKQLSSLQAQQKARKAEIIREQAELGNTRRELLFANLAVTGELQTRNNSAGAFRDAIRMN